MLGHTGRVRTLQDQAVRAAPRLVEAFLCAVVALALLPAVAVVALLGPRSPVSQGVLGTVRGVADRYREVAAGALDHPVSARYLPGLPTVRDPAVRRDIAWLAVQVVLGLLPLPLLYGMWEAITGIAAAFSTDVITDVVVGIALVPVLAVALLLVLGMVQLQALVGATLLGAGDGALARRVAELTASRAATVDASAAELRRIERDLHDGAQARLAAVGMTLGLAATFVRTDPARAEALLAEARDDAGKALSELRDLVRGIHPPVLADRGLEGGLAAAALLCPVPVTVDIELTGRTSAPVESAVYFAAAEALANVGKHARADHAVLTARHRDGMLLVRVSDDGVGGADPTGGSGLRGIQRRLAAFDGRLTVTSPPGGPTELTMELPCPLLPSPSPASASSSPKITSSSATG